MRSGIRSWKLHIRRGDKRLLALFARPGTAPSCLPHKGDIGEVRMIEVVFNGDDAHELADRMRLHVTSQSVSRPSPFPYRQSWDPSASL
jgi:hypothetical protein